MISRKLYGTASATANNVQSITIPGAGTIVGVQWCVRVNSITDDAGVDLEVSLSSAREIAVNAAQQCISQVTFYNNFVTSGLSNSGNNLFVPVAVRVTQGQLIYLHAVVTGTAVFDATALIWIQ